MKIKGVAVTVKRFQKGLLGVVMLAYGVWAYTGPLDTLAIRYGDSGLTWGILVFGLLIPYSAYIILNIFQTREKGKRKNSDAEE